MDVTLIPDGWTPDDDVPPSVVRLVERGCKVDVLDAHETLGRIQGEGVPGFGYSMRRDGQLVWALSVRSIIRTHHRVTFADGMQWHFETPLFTWMNVRGLVGGEERLLGNYRWTKRWWSLWIEPESEAPELLAAVAFMHLQWVRW